jgi:glutathione peroxidase
MMRKRWWIGGTAALLIGIGGAVGYAKFVPEPTPPLANAAKLSAWSFKLTAIDGAALPLSKFKGKVVLLVNSASKCGYTPQYDGLQKLHLDYQAQGFTVLAVPSGDFLGQEFASNKEISGFCQTKFGIKFPMTEKEHVVGAQAIPIYRWAAARLGADNTPKWNFHKYLIGRDGQLITAFGSKIEPGDPAVKAAVESALKVPAKA